MTNEEFRKEIEDYFKPLGDFFIYTQKRKKSRVFIKCIWNIWKKAKERFVSTLFILIILMIYDSLLRPYFTL